MRGNGPPNQSASWIVEKWRVTDVTWQGSLPSRLRDGEAVIGDFVKPSDPTIAELLAGAGLDVLIADLEHSSLALRDVEAIVRATELRSVPVLVRIAAYDIVTAGRLLDTGVVGIQLTGVTESATPPHEQR